MTAGGFFDGLLKPTVRITMVDIKVAIAKHGFSTAEKNHASTQTYRVFRRVLASTLGYHSQSFTIQNYIGFGLWWFQIVGFHLRKTAHLSSRFLTHWFRLNPIFPVKRLFTFENGNPLVQREKNKPILASPLDLDCKMVHLRFETNFSRWWKIWDDGHNLA